VAGGVLLDMTRPEGRPRLPDWPERLVALVEARRRMWFEWGTHDCTSFACDAVLTVTGADPWAQHRGTYGDEEGAERILAAHGGMEMLAEVTFRTFGAPDCPTDLAQRGDVGLVKYGNTRSLGVILGGSVAVPGLDGLGFLPVRNVVRAWAI
jgi:hypothetical protein